MVINWMKVLGIGLSVGGAAIGVAQSLIEKKELDTKIAEKVAEALAEKSK